MWTAIRTAHEALRSSGALDRLRATQARGWLWAEVRGALEQRLRSDPAVADAVPAVEREVAAGETAPSAGAARLLDLLGWT